jgi:acetyl-CoA/propionyl-CoA carboxylase biotin carboxyl carrier protein
VLPFHRAIVRDPAFAPADGHPFTIYTNWIETEFQNDIEPWSGAMSDAPAAEGRHSVVVEVEGKRIQVGLPTKLLATGTDKAKTAAPRRRSSGHAVVTATGDSITAPMQATVVKLAVADGDQVVKGDLVLVLEAMKMEQPLTAHKDGTVAGINTTVGATVSSGHLLLNIL